MARVPRTDDDALTRAGNGVGRGRRRSGRWDRILAVAASSAALAGVAGCGSASPGDLPPAASVPTSPAPSERPDGTVRAIGGHPQEVVIDPATHVAAVTFAGSSALRQLQLPSLRDVAGKDAGLAATAAPAAIAPDGAASTTPGASAVAPGTAAPGTVAALREGSLLAVLRPRERVLEIYDASTMRRVSSAAAGVGPTHVVCAPQGPCFVLDTDGQALLVMRVGDGGRDLRLTRRVYLAGSPYGVALDPTHSRTRLWITLPDRNQLIELAAQGRPHVLSRRPTVRQPDAVAVDPSTGDVVLAGKADGELQFLADPASPNR